MKLSEMNTDQLTDVLCRLVEPVCTLLEDEKVQEVFCSLRSAGLTHTSPTRAWGMMVSNLVPVMLQRHNEETFCVAAALLDMPVEKLRTSNGAAMISALCKCWDEELVGFFPCAADMAKKICCK